MRPLVGGLMVLFLVPLSTQLRPSTPETAVVDEISRLLSQPGVYLDSLTATPRLVRVSPVVAKEIDVRVKRDEKPVVAQYPGARASVRSASIEPVFYLYKNRPEMFYSSKGKLDVWLVTLEPQADNRRLRLGTAKPDSRGGSIFSVRIKEVATPMVVETLPGDLYRVTPPSPLAPGEYALVSAMIFIETVDRFVLRLSGGPVKLKTPIFDFGIEVP
jgi:hypothetical protein